MSVFGAYGPVIGQLDAFRLPLVPYPKHVEINGALFELPRSCCFHLDLGDFSSDESAQWLEEHLLTVLAECGCECEPESESIQIRCRVVRDLDLSEQGYELRITEDGINIIGRATAGIFYGLQTLKQLLRTFGKNLPCLFVRDYPDFPNRGYMLDVSRDRVPKMDELKKLIDVLAELKYNQLQLYMEHTFAYSRHQKVWEGYSPFTAEEIREIDEYCRSRFIELVPNQNTFGHMTRWLIHGEYRHLAEAPDGFVTPWGTVYEYPFSLSPALPESTSFVEELLSELLPNFRSPKVNIGCDETFDLCTGRSKELCEKFGPGRVYFDFLMKIYGIAKRFKDRVMFWGDIVENHPELIPELPKDMIPMVWGYEADHPFSEKCPLYKESGLEYYVCPGTSTWNSFIGRTANAFENIRNAAINGLEHGASGILLTDWGDNGHPQPPVFSLLPISYAAAFSWNSKAGYLNQTDGHIDEFFDAVDVQIFTKLFGPTSEGQGNGKRPSVSHLLYDLGNVHRELPYTPNGTMFFYALIFPERFENSLKNLSVTETSLVREKIEKLVATAGELRNERLTEQITVASGFALAGLRVLELLLSYGEIRKIPLHDWNGFLSFYLGLLEDYKKLWMETSRPGGLEQSTNKLKRILRVRNGDTRGLIF